MHNYLMFLDIYDNIRSQTLAEYTDGYEASPK